MIDDAIPKELERVCLRALAKRPTERYTTARDMAEDIRTFLGQAADRREGGGQREVGGHHPMPIQTKKPGLPPRDPIRDGVLLLEGYSYRREIGRQDTYLAEEQRSGRVVVIRVLRQENMDEADYAKAVQISWLAKRVRHPAIVSVLDVIERGEVCYVVRDHFEGFALRDLLFSDPDRLTRLNCADLFRQVAEGLGHAHAHGLVHGNLTPEHVLIDQRGAARVVFPGRYMMGTPAYLSPEQIVGTANSVDGRTDIWSLVSSSTSA
jgi:hypothetical protein